MFSILILIQIICCVIASNVNPDADDVTKILRTMHSTGKTELLHNGATKISTSTSEDDGSGSRHTVKNTVTEYIQSSTLFSAKNFTHTSTNIDSSPGYDLSPLSKPYQFNNTDDWSEVEGNPNVETLTKWRPVTEKISSTDLDDRTSDMEKNSGGKTKTNTRTVSTVTTTTSHTNTPQTPLDFSKSIRDILAGISKLDISPPDDRTSDKEKNSGGKTTTNTRTVSTVTTTTSNTNTPLKPFDIFKSMRDISLHDGTLFKTFVEEEEVSTEAKKKPIK